MNGDETTPTVPAATGDLNERCACMQRQMTWMLVALIVVSCTLTVFLWRQVRYAKRDFGAMKPPAMQVINNFNQNKPAMDAFVLKLTEFGRSHPDFMPILNKYHIPVSTTAPPASAVAPKLPAAPATNK